MIGLEKITKKDGGFKNIPISELLKFFNENPKYFDIPVSFETLMAINEWTNSFIHTGLIPFCWQSLEAIDLIEKLALYEIVWVVYSICYEQRSIIYVSLRA